MVFMTRVALLILSLGTGPLHADEIDWKTIPRQLVKEPSYQGKPQYALLAFGPKAEHRHWLVLDGNSLYFDRNGNGDLTEAGERIEVFADYTDDTQRYFKLGDLTTGGRAHVKLVAVVKPIKAVRERDSAPAVGSLDVNSATLEVWGEFEIPGYRGRCDHGRVPRMVGPFDHDGYLLWKPSPSEASIVHFGEAWSLQMQGVQQVLIGIENDLIINVGSRGFGTGTFAKLGYEYLVPEGIQPRLKLLCRNGSGVQEHDAILKERC
jgi:hypothetical protein